MTAATRTLVRRRAADRCEYCRLHQDDSPLAALHIEHIRPRKHGGTDHESNLCLACIDCNLRKGPNLTGIDPLTGAVTALFIRASNGGRIILHGRESTSPARQPPDGRPFRFWK